MILRSFLISIFISDVELEKYKNKVFTFLSREANIGLMPRGLAVHLRERSECRVLSRALGAGAYIFIVSASRVLAQSGSSPLVSGPEGSGVSGPSGTLPNPLNANTIPEFIASILNIVVQIGVPIVALFIIYSGFLFVKARGNPEELKTAKTAIVWTLIGAAILLGASVLADVIGGTISDLGV